MEVKLFVGNLTFDTTEQQLRTMFTDAGSVVTVDVIKDRDTGTAKGFAFITMGTQADALKAISLFHGKEIGGRALTVNTAKAREERPSGGRSYNTPTHRSRGGAKKNY